MKCDPNSKGRWDMTPLHCASEGGYLDVVKYLVESHHCDPLCPDEDKQTPLHLASSKGHLDVVRYFTAIHNSDTLVKNTCGNTPLHYAALEGKLDVVKYFIGDMKCDSNIRNIQQRPPLHLSIEKGHFNVSKYLIDLEQHNKQQFDRLGEATLLLAIQKGCSKTVDYLINNKYERLDYDTVQLVRKAALTPELLEIFTKYVDPLHYAATVGDMENILYYIEREKWCPLMQDEYGDNLLHVAAIYGQLEVVKYLTGGNELKKTSQFLCDPAIKNRNGLTALELASKKGKKHIESYLLRATTNQIVMNQYALSPSIRILVIGNSGSGKSTLVKALCQNNFFLGKIMKVKGVVPLTAGIIPTTLQSKVFGSVSIYDFAGHEEYYASHEIILQQVTQPLVLIAIDISLPAADTEKQMLYWLSILSNAVSIKKHQTFHLIVVGSHADQVSNEIKISVEQTLSSAIDSETGESIQFHGLISCDCRYSGSSHMEHLRQKLNAVCMSVRRHIAHMESNYSNMLCASLMHYLQHNISYQAPTITISKLRELIEQLEGPDQTLSLFELIDQDLLLCTCENLHSIGHLLFLPNNQNMNNSIIVLNQNTVLSRIHSCLGIIKKSLRNNIGMLEESELERVLHEHLKDMMSPDLAIKYLIFTQFCTKVSPDQLLSTPENLTSSIYYFFPNLVLSEKPSNLWSTENEDYTHLYTWCLKCSNPHHFFTPRFLHTLFIQLFQCEEDSNDAGFTIWKNGILIVHCNTTRSIIEVTNQTTRLNLMMQCRKEHKSYLVKQRSKFISMIKSLRNKICSNLELDEFFLPSQKSYPPEAVTKISLSKVARSLMEGYPSVVVSEDDDENKYHNIYYTSDLLLDDSFLLMNKALAQEMAMNRHSDTCVPHVTLEKILESLEPYKDLITMMQNEAGSGMKEITYSQLFRELCKYSVFTDGNLYESAGTELPKPKTLYDKSVHESSDPIKCDSLNLKDLYIINVRLLKVANKWKEFGIALGMNIHTLEVIKCDLHDVERCLTEILATWLNGQDRPRDSPPCPSWKEVFDALKSPTVNMKDHATQLIRKLTDDRDDSVKDFDLVDSGSLGIGSIAAVRRSVHSLNHKWFHLGLSLGLSYSTLKSIEASHHYDIGDHMTDMLQKWLEGADEDIAEEFRGPSSWRSLALALDCPLVREHQVALNIKSEHEIPEIHL